MIKSIPTLFLLVVLAAPSVLAQNYQKGVVIVSQVTGTATVRIGFERPVQLKQGFRIYEGATIETGEDGNISLVFANGSSLVVDKNSKVTVKEFKVVPYKSTDVDDLADLDFEPTLSQTKLKVEQGNLVGNVKKLNYEQGSYYEIESPVGTAGIRGTNWTLTIVVDVQRGVSGAFGISKGGAVFVDLLGTANTVGPKAVVTISGKVDAQGAVEITTVDARTMTEAEAAAVENQVAELVALVEATDTVSLSGAGENTDEGSNEEGEDEGESNEDEGEDEGKDEGESNEDDKSDEDEREVTDEGDSESDDQDEGKSDDLGNDRENRDDMTKESSTSKENELDPPLELDELRITNPSGEGSTTDPPQSQE